MIGRGRKTSVIGLGKSTIKQTNKTFQDGVENQSVNSSLLSVDLTQSSERTMPSLHLKELTKCSLLLTVI